ncbi:MAG: hypothetical protein GXN99_01740 [Candidatus Nanohaloarchaeota archaeon]|nr:hypothetical protein [Candidatus Nanohaloarchaeota archaeon]
MKKAVSLYAFLAVMVSVILGLMLSSKVYAPTAASNDTIQIFVNVSAKTMVDINPDSLAWYDVYPGEEFGSAYEANNYENIWIENIGSVNISYVWFNNSFPSARPFGTGNPLAYDPANFVVIANNSVSSPDSAFMYINRVEYEEDDPLYVKVPNTALGDVGVIFARFRNGTREYFFEYVSSYVGTNCSNGVFYINVSSPKTKTDTGDVDLTDNALPDVFVPVTIDTAGGILDGQQYDVGAVDFGGGEKYCVFIPVNCGATGAPVFFVRWNADFLASSGLPSSCAALGGGYINNDVITPGGFYKAWIRVRVPYGTAQGDLSTGTVTVFVMA